MRMTAKETDIYWQGYYAGRKNSLKPSLNMLRMILKAGEQQRKEKHWEVDK